MTEEDAKTKWCPMARVAFHPEAVNGCNRPFEHPFQACIASACMAWRTRTMGQNQRAAMFRDERRLHPDMTDDQLWSRVNGYDHPDGYCGLAGAPQ